MYSYGCRDKHFATSLLFLGPKIILSIYMYLYDSSIWVVILRYAQSRRNRQITKNLNYCILLSTCLIRSQYMY